MIKKILLAYDGSPDAENALAFAIELAHTYNSEMHVLAVVQPPDFGGDVESEALIDRTRKHLGGVLRALRTRLAPEPKKIEYEIAVGHVAERIVTRAAEVAADHIVIGHRGHSRIGRWLTGSVARRVVDEAQCAVTVVKRTTQEQQ